MDQYIIADTVIGGNGGEDAERVLFKHSVETADRVEAITEISTVKIGKNGIFGLGRFLSDLCIGRVKKNVPLIVHNPDFCREISAQHFHL